MTRYALRLVSVVLTMTACFFPCSIVANARQSSTSAVPYPKHLPYRFSNAPWWTEDELRLLLKKRIPGLGDEMATTPAAERAVRDALTVLLKEKGVTAEVQSEEPSLSAIAPIRGDFFGAPLPERPHPAIIFSLLTPRVVVGKITLQDIPEDAVPAIQGDIQGDTGRPYNAIMTDFEQEQLAKTLVQRGYLEARVNLKRQLPVQEGETYRVDTVVAAIAGPQYHVGALGADGGPLLAGRDLKQYFVLKPGDTAGQSPFGSLGLQIRALYQHKGYADVDIEGEPVLDHDHALANYRLTVIPGPIYHLRSLTVEKLTPDQEAKVRGLLGMKVGDPFDETAITQLYRKVSSDPLLKGLGFSFSPKKDQAAAAADLTLTFYKEGGEATVTVR
ncbi:MAG TPA: hypothetical protein VL346_02270 [Acidobacteriaceae bacterium]|nr:hypothetical protein [Acidobacteriaceae bacterium]